MKRLSSIAIYGIVGTFLATSTISTSWIVTPAFADAASDAKAADAKADQLVKDIKTIKDAIDAKTKTQFGASIAAIDTPNGLLDKVKELDRLLKANTKEKLSRPESARYAVLSALQTLYKGRGNTVPKDGTGWYLGSRNGVTGVNEIQTILNMNILDQQGLDSFKDFVEKHDFTVGSNKTGVGFPPAFDIGNDSAKAQILSSISSASPGADFQSATKIKTVLEIAQSANSPRANKAAEDLLGMLEKNHFDKSIGTMNDGKEFPNYFGRNKEQNEVLDVLTKGQKQHLLITGPAGAGKTTIMQALQDRFVKGDIKIRNEEAPIFLELPITAVTNPSDPSAIKGIVANAAAYSEETGRRVVIFVDEGHVATKMTQNALKGFLTDLTRPAEGHSKVHVFFATTSAESQEFMSDTAFSRRFSALHVAPFNREDTIKLVRQTLLPRWKNDHMKDGWKLEDISDDALEYAYRYRKTEQQFSETGTQELLESAIVAKMNRETDPLRNGGKTPGPVKLGVEDVRDYIAQKFNVELMPGDPKFKEKFENLWQKFEDKYVGNEGMKSELKAALRSHFGQPNKKNMTALAVFGPPGGGKTYGAEQVADTFFHGAILETNGAELKNGGLELNKLIGSPPGVKDSDNRGELTRMLREHPEGFVWKIEEGDYMHQDVVDLKTNIITSKKFKDGLGKEWDASKIMIWENSNIGQDLMIPQGADNKMDWTQYQMRRANITQKALIEGKEIDRVKPEVMQGVFRNYIDKIVMGSNPGQDTSVVEQEAAKQIRRYTPLYVLPPTKEELLKAGHVAVKKYINDMKLEHGITVEVPDETILKLIDLDHYNFKTGQGYVNSQLERKLFDPLLNHISERGAHIKVGLEDTKVLIDGEEVPAQNLLVSLNGGAPLKESLGAIDTGEKNPWGTNKAMMEKIDSFTDNMSKHVKGNEKIIEDMGRALKEKSIDWKANTTFTFLGTSGNGKTEMAKSLAKSLFDTPDALFTITGVDHPWDLGDYFRPPTGIQGGNKETQFERWFMSRKNAGGGVILFDELLSEIKAQNTQVDGQKGGKLAVLQELYEFLAERRLKINGTYHDASAFIPVITGNSLQEIFAGLDDNPETDALVKKIMARLTRSQIVNQLGQIGLDPPKTARLGRVYVMGPQPKNIQLAVGEMKLANNVAEIKKFYGKPLEIVMDKDMVHSVVDRLSTIKLGMREVETGFRTLAFQPMKTLLSDIGKTQGVPISKIEMKLVPMLEDPDHLATHWFVNGKEVVEQAVSTGNDTARKINWVFKDQMTAGAENLTPTTKMLNSVEKTKVSEKLLTEINEHELYGHWMVNALINQKNGAEFVSTIPGPGYLGYVRPKAQEVHDVTNLTTMMKRINELEAGHRANQYFGSFATGGGNDGAARQAGKDASDDLGKINKYYNMLINNSMLPGVGETSSEAEKKAVIEILEKVMDHSTDELLDVGIKSGQFKEAFDDLQKKRYLKEDELEGYLKKIDFKKIGYHGPDALFLEKFSAGFAKTLDDSSMNLRNIDKALDPRGFAIAEKEVARVKQLAGAVLGRLFKEAETRSAADHIAMTELTHIKTDAIEAVRNPASRMVGRMKINCSKAYEDLFEGI